MLCLIKIVYYIFHNIYFNFSIFIAPMDKQTMEQEQQLQNLYKNIPQSIIANFHTHLTEYQISNNTQIDISTDLDEDALNKITKQILQSTLDQQTLDKVSFDFLVNEKLLRGKLKSHIVRYEISCEQVITIQYFIAFRQLQNMKQSPVQDWVSSICEVIGLQSNIGVMSALFDGSVVFHQKFTKKQSKNKHKVHQSIIKSIKSMPSQIQNTYYVITGGIQQQLKVSKFAQNSQLQIISINQHDGSILALDINPVLDGHLCSAGSQGKLNIWKITQNFLSDENLNIKTEKKKKRKTNKKHLPSLASERIHSDAINSICWINSDTIATGSSDHSIKFTDVEKIRQKRIFMTKDSITTGIDYNNEMLFSCHEDGYIRTWDARSNSTNPAQVYKSHSRFASAVKTLQHSNLFSSGSYDQTVKVWDIRSVFPLQTIATNYDKVFAVCWKSKSQVVSGGSNPFLTLHSVQ